MMKKIYSCIHVDDTAVASNYCCNAAAETRIVGKHP